MIPKAEDKLPLWRLILGLAVLGSFAAIIIFLTPVYVDDFRLYRYAHDLPAAGDDAMTSEVVARAHELNLPVRAADIHISHTRAKPKIEMRYTVKMDLLIYPVDLHFPTFR